MSEASRLRAELRRTFATTAYGRAITLRRTTPGAYAQDGSAGAATTTDYAGVGRVGAYEDRLIDGTRILATDRRVTFVPTDESFRAQPADLVIVGSDTYSVINAQMREIGGELIAYTLQVR